MRRRPRLAVCRDGSPQSNHTVFFLTTEDTEFTEI